MARVDETKDDRHTETVKVSQIVDCPECDTPFDVVFDTGELDMEMVDEEIAQEVQCPSCKHTWIQEYDGWTHHTDAG